MEGRSKAKLDFRMNAPANLLSHTSHTFHQRAHQLPILLCPSFVYTPPFPPPPLRNGINGSERANISSSLSYPENDPDFNPFATRRQAFSRKFSALQTLINLFLPPLL